MDGNDRGDMLEQVRDALRHLHDYAYLQTHPLARFTSQEQSNDAWNVGRRLSQALQEAIASLQPGHTSSATAPAQRRHRLLTLRYLDELETPAVQQALAISRSTYQRELAAALEAVTSLIRSRWQRDDVAAAWPTSQLTQRTLSPSRRLPIWITSFVGRARELAEIEHLLSSARLITLTGPPGTGKTRLALQAAALHGESFADGVCFVSLAAISDPTVVLPAIAQALGVQEASGRPLVETLQEQLRDRRLLLVLDNFEHVLSAAPLVATLLQGVPQLTVLATSRAPLRVGGEHDYLIPPLTLPDRASASSLAACLESEAVRLFLERARAVRSDFTLSDENTPDVAEICRRLDGLPLAIELAAARLRFLPPSTLLARLERRLPLLTGGDQDLPARHQTLRAAIDWSHDLLDSSSQTLFRRLAVFAGGFTLEAAEAVTSSASPVFDGLSALVEQRLLWQVQLASGEPRFGMLESLREYAWEQLEANIETDSLQQRHAQYYLELAEANEGQYLAGDPDLQARRVLRLETEYNNLRAALRWFEEQQLAEESMRLAGAMAWFWLSRNRWTEGLHWLDRSLQLPGAEDQAPARALALLGMGVFALARGDSLRAHDRFAESVAIWRLVGNPPRLAAALAGQASAAGTRDPSALPLAEESLALYRGLHDPQGIAALQLLLGQLATFAGEHAGASRLLTESRTYWQALGDQATTAGADWRLGDLAMYQGDYRTAQARFEASLSTYRALDEQHSIARQGLAVVLVRLGELADHAGSYDLATARLQEALLVARDLGDREVIAWALTDLGRVARHQGNEAEAMDLFREALVTRQQQGHPRAIADCLYELAEGALRAGQYERAAHLFAAAEGKRDVGDAYARSGDLFTYAREAVERQVATVRANMDEREFRDAWSAGMTTDLDQAVSYAMIAEDSLTIAGHASSPLRP